MYTYPQKLLFRSICELLKPIARIMVKAGLGHREFSEAAKFALIKTVKNDYGSGDRPTSVTRCQILTGLTRKEARRLRDTDVDYALEREDQPTPVIDVINKWSTDRRFLDQLRKPRPLKIEGGEGSFDDLVKSVARDIAPAAMLREMRRIKAVRDVVGEDKIEITGRVCDVDDSRIEEVAKVIEQTSIHFSNAWVKLTDGEDLGLQFRSKIVQIKENDESLWKPILDQVAHASNETLNAYSEAYEELQGAGRNEVDPLSKKPTYSIGVFCYRMD